MVRETEVGRSVRKLLTAVFGQWEWIEKADTEGYFGGRIDRAW